MNELCRRAGLQLMDVIKTPIHGTSYVFVIGHRPRREHIKNLIAMEADLLKNQTYHYWANTAKQISLNFLTVCEWYREQGYRLVGYGAAAKGNTLLNYADVALDYIIDDNQLKQGTYSPGKDIPVVDSTLLDTLTDKDRVLFVPLAWNVYNEIKNKIQKRRSNPSDKFLRYFPEVEVE
jgi:hypothetical protein